MAGRDEQTSGKGGEAVLPDVTADAYTIEEEIGRGGLGRILQARHRGTGRLVALKVLLARGPDAEARFIREALVTARLEHPAIVPVYEAGRWPSGEPFFAMRLIGGRPLSEHIKACANLAERMALLPHVLHVAEALAYAHSKGIVHRDVKPANVLIGPFGETTLIDWGLAKDLNDPAPATASATPPGDAETTQVGEVMGTPAYMSPEQALGGEVDERADVYALGALLYHVLAGAPPHEVAGDETVRDSAQSMMERVAHVPPVPLEVRERRAPDELLALVGKAMARDREARYLTALGVAEDLRRFQTGQLVSAHRYTAWERFTRWLRRYRTLVATGAAALVTSAVVGGIAVKRIIEARRDAEAERSQAQLSHLRAETRAAQLLLLQARDVLGRDPTTTLAWLNLYPADGADWTRVRDLAADARSRGIATHVWRISSGKVLTVAVSPDGRTMAASARDGSIRLWDVASGRARILSGHAREVSSLGFAPDGGTLYSGSFDGQLRAWQLGANAPETSRLLGEHESMTKLAVAPDGRTVATVGFDHVVRLWDTVGGPPRTLTGHTLGIAGVAFSPDGKLIATASEDRTVRLWDVTDLSAAPRVVTLPNTAGELTFAPDGRFVYAVDRDVLQRIDVRQGGFEAVPSAGANPQSIALSPDGKLLATGGLDGTVRVLDLVGGTRRTLGAHDGGTLELAFTPDSQALISSSYDGTVRRWALPRMNAVLLRSFPLTSRPAMSPDGRHAAIGGDDGTVHVWRLPGGEERRLEGHTGGITHIAFSPDGARMATTALDRTVRVWDLDTGAGRVVATGRTGTFRPAFDPVTGRSLIFTEAMESLHVLDLDSGRERCRTEGHENSASVWAPSGGRVIYANDTEVRSLDLATCTARVLYRHGAYVFNFAWSADGAWMASAGREGMVGLWRDDAASVRLLEGHENDVYGVAFSRDGRRLASASFDRTVRVWDVPEGRVVSVLRGHDKLIGYVAFSPDGSVVFTAGLDDVLRGFDAVTGELVARIPEVAGGGFVLSPDGRYVVAANAARSAAYLWPVQLDDRLPADPRELARWLAGATTARIDEANQATTPVP